jgi:hypothetical protein
VCKVSGTHKLASRQVPPDVVSKSVKSSCRTWFGPVGFDRERRLAAAP